MSEEGAAGAEQPRLRPRMAPSKGASAETEYAVPMSLWTRPIFGKAPDPTPASAVAVRCARIRMAAMSRWLPIFNMGVWAGLLILNVEFVLMGQLAAAPFLGAGAPTTPGTPTRATFLLDQIKAIQIWTWLGGAAVLAIFSWGVPLLVRWHFDRTAGKRTRAMCRKGRKSRRGQNRVMWVLAIVCVVVPAPGFAIFAPWGVPCMFVAAIGAKWGTPVAAWGLLGRRGSELVCARCDYPMRTWRGAGACCLECGNAWREPWRARFGVRRVDWRWVALGGGMVAASALLMAAVGRWGIMS